MPVSSCTFLTWPNFRSILNKPFAVRTKNTSTPSAKPTTLGLMVRALAREQRLKVNDSGLYPSLISIGTSLPHPHVQFGATHSGKSQLTVLLRGHEHNDVLL
uniref:Uncharacterized protein n=1 Tax=Arundo donax TaxID=35708 RepID=A0A0A9D3T4_ARUDO